MANSFTTIVAKNTALQIVIRFTTLGLSLLTIPFITRSLGPELYGQYSLVAIYLSFAMSLSDFGVQQIAVREMAKNPEHAVQWIAQTTVIRTLFALVTSLVGIILIYLLDQTHLVRLGMLIALSGTVFIALQSGTQAFLQSKLNLKVIAYADLISKVITTLLVLGVIFFSKQLQITEDALFLLLVAISTSAYLIMMLYIIFSGRKVAILRIADLDWQLSRQVLHDSFPLWILSIFGLIHYRIDSILLDSLKGSYEVGLYNVAYKILEISITFSTLFMTSVYPLLSHAMQHDKARAQRITQKAFDFLSILGISIIFGTIVVSEHLVNILGGDEFMPAVPALRILICAIIFSYMNNLFSNILIVNNNQKRLILVGVATVIVNILLNILLIPYYSIVGSAASTVATEALGMGMSMWLAVKLFGIRVNFSVLGKALISAMVMLLITWNIRDWNIIVVSVTGAIIFATTLYFLRGIDKDVLTELRSSRG